MPTLIGSSTSEFATLTQLREHLNITTAVHDPELQQFLGAAQEHVEQLIGPVLRREVAEECEVVGGTVYLEQSPVISVASVAVGGSALSGWVLKERSGLIRKVSASAPVTVTYTAGRLICPDAVIVATLIIAEHLWRTQLGGSPSALPLDDPSGAPWSAGFALPKRALDLLAPYLLPPGVA